MQIPKSPKVRVTILLSGLVLLAILVAGLYLFQQQRRQSQLAADRRVGLEAFTAGDYATATEKLSRYISRQPNDAEVLYRFAQASLHMAGESTNHLRHAEQALSWLVRIEPENITAAVELLELYRLFDHDQRALEVAEHILERQPEHLEALRHYAIVLTRSERPEEALDVAERFLQLKPRDIQILILHQQLRHTLDTPAATLIAEATEQVEAHPRDPRYETLLAQAYYLADDTAAAEQWLRQAASRVPPDHAFMELLLRFLDRANLYPESIKVLSSGSGSDETGRYFRELVRRLYEQYLYEDLASLDIDINSNDVIMLGLHALASHEAGRTETAQQVIAALADRRDNDWAQGWARLLSQKVLSDQQDIAGIIEACRLGLRGSPQDGYLHFFLAQAYRAANENERAVQAYGKATEQRPSWAAAWYRQVLPLINMGQSQNAVRVAQIALQRLPGSIHAREALITARFADLPTAIGDSPPALMRSIDEALAIEPDHENILLIKVALHARMGQRDQAQTTARRLLDKQPAAATDTLHELLRLSRQNNLNLEQPCFDAMRQSGGLPPQVKLEQALTLAQGGRIDDGLAILETEISDPASPDALRWGIARAQYLDAYDPAAGVALWQSLLETHPRAINLCLAYLGARAASLDADLTDQVITRLQNLTGEDALNWRMARAYWQLQQPDPLQGLEQTMTLLRQVISQAPHRVQARMMLARAYEVQGRHSQAIREAQSASQMQPGNPQPLLELARLQQQARSFSEARDNLLRVANDTRVDGGALRRAAIMLAQQGDRTLAIEALERFTAQGRAAGTDVSQQDAMLLAALYRWDNRIEPAEAICRQLLDDPTPEAVAFVARFYESIGRSDRVDQAVAMLAQMSLPPGTLALLRGDIAAQRGDADAAIDYYRQAVREVPGDPALAQRLILFLLGRGDGRQAVEAAAEVAADLNHPGIDALLAHRQTIATLEDDLTLLPLYRALLVDQGHRSVAADAVRLLTEAPEPKLALDQLVSLANEHPGFLALQILTARLLIEDNRLDQAIRMASRAMRDFPTAAEPAWLAAEAHSRAGQWDQAMVAANRWRQRAEDQRLEADLLIAHARFQMGQPVGAMQQIEPYVDNALANPDDHVLVVLMYVQSLVGNRRYDRAEQIMLPLLPRDPGWRLAWMEMAVTMPHDRATSIRWLEQLQPHVAANDGGELLAMAQAWWLVRNRFNNRADGRTARQYLEQAMQQGQRNAQTWFMHGVMMEKEDDLAQAQRSYQQALAEDDNFHAARNNLAMIYVRTGSNLSEALALAQQAVHAQPDNATFHDTLAHALVATDRVDDAIEAILKAIALEPQQQKWREHLSQLLADAGRQEEEAALLQRVQ